MRNKFTVGALQVSGLEIYILDPIHEEFDGEAFPGTLEGKVLTVTDKEVAWRMLTDAANSTDESDKPISLALGNLASRILRS